MATETRGQGGSGGVLGRPARWIESLGETGFAYLLLAPVFVLLGVISIWPLVSTFEMSLHADNLIGTADLGEFVGLQNYVEILTGQRRALLPQPFFDPNALWSSALVVTLVFAVVSVFFETLIGFGQALVLDQEFAGRRWVRAAIILPWAVPIVIQGMMFYLMFAPTIGFATQPLQNLGLISSTPLANSQDTLLIVIIADIWKTSAFMALLILAGLQSVDRSLYDVARVAGASHWQRFRRITLPLILPTLLVAMLFRSIQAMRVFGLIESVSSCSTLPSLSCLVISTFRIPRYGTSAAIAFITAAIIGVAVSIYVVFFASGEAEVL